MVFWNLSRKGHLCEGVWCHSAGCDASGIEDQFSSKRNRFQFLDGPVWDVALLLRAQNHPPISTERANESEHMQCAGLLP